MESRGIEITEGVVFGAGGGRELRCDIVAPEESVTGASAVVLLHGGAWRMGTRQMLRGYATELAKAGFVCVCSEYRLTPEARWPDHIHDVKAALRYVRANAAELGVDPAKIAVLGNSAGAHLAMFAAGTPNVAEFEGDGGHAGAGTQVAAAVGIYTPTVFHSGERVRGSVPLDNLMGDDQSPEIARAVSPLTYVNDRFPPTLLIHGTDDKTVPPSASMVLYEELVKARVPVDLHMVARQGHGFDFRPELMRLCVEEISLFLDRFVRDPERFAAQVRRRRTQAAGAGEQ